jgi:flavin-dependent dehydrogenase
MAIGDAALAFDPIASQGLAHALGSAIVAAGALRKHNGVSARVRYGYELATIATRLRSAELASLPLEAAGTTRPTDA